MRRKDSTSRKSVPAVMLIAVFSPFSFPGDACTLLARKAAAISPAVRPRAASFTGSTHTRIASGAPPRSEEHTSELQSLMRISYAVFCLNKKQQHQQINK